MSTPAQAIVLHDELAPRRGARTVEELEAATPLGRALHWVESQQFGISTLCAGSRDQGPVWRHHDALADEANAANEVVGSRMLEHPDPVVRAWGICVLDHCRAYRRHDEAEDAVCLGFLAAFERIHAISRRVAGWVERTCRMLRTKA